MVHDENLLSTALHARHVELGAKMVGFGGWDMPVSYPSGTIAEHLACRNDAVVFDVSHLGTVRVEGPDALELLQSTLSNDLAKIAPGRAQYTQLLNDEGGVRDDIIVWWVDDERFDVMPNASNTERVRSVIGGVDVTSSRSVLAVQGPNARARLSTVSEQAASVKRNRVERIEILGIEAVVAGTGYTGEDGVEIAIDNAAVGELFDALLAAGIVPAGLGARDTLRLEAALPLHGQDLSETISPLEAGLSWSVGWDKPAFPGRDALLAQRATGPSRELIGLRTATRQPPRSHSAVETDGRVLGEVTSGNFSPLLESGIALALVATGSVELEATVDIDLRGRKVPATRVALPFVTKKKG